MTACCECGRPFPYFGPAHRPAFCSALCAARAGERAGRPGGVRRLLAAVALGSAAVGLLVMVAALLSAVVR